MTTNNNSKKGVEVTLHKRIITILNQFYFPSIYLLFFDKINFY